VNSKEGTERLTGRRGAGTVKEPEDHGRHRQHAGENSMQRDRRSGTKSPDESPLGEKDRGKKNTASPRDEPSWKRPGIEGPRYRRSIRVRS